ncbi:hypothetical protein MMC24_001473 [Lignoscripta atroalba]|nr:hypothetical protein [Lignoscripta atroalba]
MANSQLSDPVIPDWEIEEGLPQPTDPFIQKYLAGREALIEQERSTRSDASFRSSLTPLAAEACTIVSRIRAEEHQDLWTDEFQDSLLGEEYGGPVYPGMMFTLARGRMEKSKLWQIVRKMPKGALLHAHFDAMIDIEWLVGVALATEGMCMWADENLQTREARQAVPVQFQYGGRSVKEDDVSIWSQDYPAKHLVPVQRAAASFPDGGREEFKKWLISRCTITMEESLDHHRGHNAVWQKFTSCFPVIGSMLFYEPIFRAAVQRLLRELLDDGVRWVDLRLAFVFEYRRECAETAEEGYEEMFQAFGEEVEKFQTTEEGRNFWGCRFIWTALRVLDKKDVVDSMKECISVKQAFPDLISGFDLVGQEDMGRTLVDLTPEIFWFRKRCVEEGVDIPFFFHAGECLGDGDSTDQNLFDAVLLGTRRIGHGFSLYKHPLLIEMVKKKSILIESCPISNEVLRLTGSILSHPLPSLLARGVAVALCNDDPAILGHGKNGLTHDFWQALQGWENLGLAGLGSLAENSVRYAAYGPDQSTQEWHKEIRDGIYGQGLRANRMREWRKEWEDFCAWIVREYSADYGGDGEDDV